MLISAEITRRSASCVMKVADPSPISGETEAFPSARETGWNAGEMEMIALTAPGIALLVFIGFVSLLLTVYAIESGVRHGGIRLGGLRFTGRGRKPCING